MYFTFVFSLFSSPKTEETAAVLCHGLNTGHLGSFERWRFVGLLSNLLGLDLGVVDMGICSSLLFKISFNGSQLGNGSLQSHKCCVNIMWHVDESTARKLLESQPPSYTNACEQCEPGAFLLL